MLGAVLVHAAGPPLMTSSRLVEAAFGAEDGKPLPGLAQVAHQQGRYLGRALLARILHHKTPEPFRFRTRGNLAVISRNAAVHLKLKGFPAWLLSHVYLLVGFQNRLVVTLRWLWAYVTFQRGSRIISGMDDGTPARPEPNADRTRSVSHKQAA